MAINFRASNDGLSGAIQINGVDVLGFDTGGFTSGALSPNGTQTVTNKTFTTNNTWNGNAIGVQYGGTGATSLTGLLKGNGTSALSAATAGTDYLAPPSGTALLKANNGGALANASAGTDYVAPNAATNFTAPQRPSLSSEVNPTTNAITWDLTVNSILRINLNANITTFNLTGTLSNYVGYQYQVAVRYNGGSSITWPATFKFAGGAAPTLTGTSGKLDIFNFVVLSNDGGLTYFLYCTGYSQNL